MTKCHKEGSLKTEDKPVKHSPEKCLHLHRNKSILDSVTDLSGVGGYNDTVKQHSLFTEAATQKPEF